eukprot:TRINITY_DN27576_c0_g1_i1.p2 TRINITY_DN27576_c0_g1~~TRINITY_DN27576_c0_g1_i1.p2  ORF type:complete len:219 (+),score=76.86 TRINITY_DN27576_c0_g1_i1:63-719(+)
MGNGTGYDSNAARERREAALPHARQLFRADRHLHLAAALELEEADPEVRRLVGMLRERKDAVLRLYCGGVPAPRTAVVQYLCDCVWMLWKGRLQQRVALAKLSAEQCARREPHCSFGLCCGRRVGAEGAAAAKQVALHERLAVAVAEELFSVADVDGDGYLSRSEWYGLRESLLPVQPPAVPDRRPASQRSASQRSASPESPVYSLRERRAVPLPRTF